MKLLSLGIAVLVISNALSGCATMSGPDRSALEPVLASPSGLYHIVNIRPNSGFYFPAGKNICAISPDASRGEQPPCPSLDSIRASYGQAYLSLESLEPIFPPPGYLDMYHYRVEDMRAFFAAKDLTEERRLAYAQKTLRMRASYDQRKADVQQKRESEAQQWQQRYQEKVARFKAGAAAPKSIGQRVCSRDNRFGWVEQIAGDRIKVALEARMIGESDYYLFGIRSLLGEVPMSGQIWDESAQWGLCEFRRLNG